MQAPGCTIGHLTVVAGPKAVGKSTFIRRLQEDEVLRRRVAIPDDAEVCTGGSWLRREADGPIDHLVLHYDILRPLERGLAGYEHDPATSALAAARAITFLTLRTTPKRLTKQLEQRIASESGSKTVRRLGALRARYDDEQFVAQWYERWLRYTGQWADVTVASSFLEVHRSYALTPVVDRPARTQGRLRTVRWAAARGA